MEFDKTGGMHILIHGMFDLAHRMHCREGHMEWTVRKEKLHHGAKVPMTVSPVIAKRK